MSHSLAKAVGISDSDTITVLRGTEQIKIRLQGATGIGIWSLPNPIPPWEAKQQKAQAQRAPPAEQQVIYHGNRRSKVFHAPWCRYYSCKNCTVVFNSRDEAINAGYKPGGHCKP